MVDRAGFLQSYYVIRAHDLFLIMNTLTHGNKLGYEPYLHALGTAMGRPAPSTVGSPSTKMRTLIGGVSKDHFACTFSCPTNMAMD